MQRTYEQMIRALLDAHGVAYELGHTKRHRFVQVGGYRYIFPTSGSDRRGVLNALADLRRALGLKRSKSCRPRRERWQAPKRVRQIERATLGEDRFRGRLATLVGDVHVEA